MAYFLKKSNTSSSKTRGTYLQIYFSFRDPLTKTTKHKSHSVVGYYNDLLDQGIEDPIAYGKQLVDQLNDEWRIEKEISNTRQISSTSPIQHFGYFGCDAILRKLDVKQWIDYLQLNKSLQYSVYEIMRDLIMARLVCPASKYKTVHDIIPTLLSHQDYSYDQTLSCLDLIGNEYEKIVEIFSSCVNETYILDTSKTFFDCTNFYFEIDKQDEFRRKGPSKENRRDPIVGLGLLMDANCIPIGMRLYPGNQSEKPVFLEALADLKKQQHVKGRTITTADKGLVSAKNIHSILSKGDGYIFSKSIKRLPELEKNWALDESGFQSVLNENGDVKYQYKEVIDRYTYSYKERNERVISFDVIEKRIVTYNPQLARKQRLEILKEVDKAKNLRLSEAKKSEYGDSAKYIIFSSTNEDGEETDSKVTVKMNEDKINHDLNCAGYNMIVTSETKLKAHEIYNIYHQLWRIEETFKTMKSQLDTRPVYLQTENRIKGHFLICYLSVVLERLFQFKVLENKFSSEQIYDFIRQAGVISTDAGKYVNTTTSSDLVTFLAKKYSLPLTNYYLNRNQIKKVQERSL